VSEIVGYKSGLALTRQELLDSISDEDTARLIDESDNGLVILRSEEFQQIIIDILYRIGNIPTPNYEWPTDELFRKYRRDSRRRKIARQVVDLFIEFMSSPSERNKPGPVNTPGFLMLVAKTHGVAGVRIAFVFLDIIRNFLHLDPFTKFRSVDWKDTAQLSELFESESLTTQYGHFFDQRYVDYLRENFDAIDKINWRKFEGLTGEFFARLGFNVEMGPGRDDGNIDVRVWRPEANDAAPPAILVQCKREKRKVSKVVVKALYADIINENADSGLIVTSTALSPGAEAVCRARVYPIQQANRETLQQWIQSMRMPAKGIFLAE
jgi:restriction system protein